MEVCTTSERLLEGIGTATFLSTCLANTACTASVWTSDRGRGGGEEEKKKKKKKGKEQEWEDRVRKEEEKTAERKG